MYELLLTKNTTFIIGQVAWVLGKLMEGIFFVLDKIASLYGGTPNIGVAIIIFTVIIYLLMLPLTIKQQKFSKMSAIMNPEIQAIQAKYKGVKDPDLMQQMQQETSAVYAKYGVSPSGSCVQLLIQMPILFALYRVIYAIPAYVPMIKNEFLNLVNTLMGVNTVNPGVVENAQTFKNSTEFIQTLSSAAAYKKQFKPEFLNIDTISIENITANLINSDNALQNIESTRNTFIDVLNRASLADWNNLAAKFPDFSDLVNNTNLALEKYNLFLGINIGYSPLDTIKSSWIEKPEGWVLLILVAVMIPLLAALTQWIGVKLAPNANGADTSNGQEDNPMMSSMKMMNTFMPIMSAVFCFTLPAGMGIYWIVGAVVRSVQQIVINKYIDKMDIDKVIEKNTAKYEEKLKKKGVLAKGIYDKAKNNTKFVNPYAQNSKSDTLSSVNNRNLKNAPKKNDKISTSGSIASKARMVKDFNEKNSK
ncbi:MAG: YidC/Oxa1 family membrane protein insertase [Lachnospiraceae bacterium]|nr:YidC/Oxa1 family membrane protein insertase [Lachnospiraceae bacterium]